MFKVGDKVVCVEEFKSDEYGPSSGATYTVTCVYTDTTRPMIQAAELPDRWYANRFVLASEYSAAENLKEQTALDIQHGGQHYKGMKIQPVEFIHANNIGYMEGNAIKYLCRWQMKNGLEDLNKAKHYIELLIEMETASESKD